MLDLKTTILAIAAALLFGATASWWITADYKEAKYQAIISQMKLDAAEALRIETNKVRAIEAENSRIATELEVAHNAYQQNLDVVKADNARLVAQYGGLYDRQTSSRGSSQASGSNSPSNTSGASSRSKLSDALTEFLLSESRRADEAALYAKTCYDWIQQVNQSQANK